MARQPTQRQQLAIEFLKQFELFPNPNCDEAGWLSLKFSIGIAEATYLLDSLKPFRTLETTQ